MDRRNRLSIREERVMCTMPWDMSITQLQSQTMGELYSVSTLGLVICSKEPGAREESASSLVCHCSPELLFLAKPFRFLNGKKQLFFQLLVALVRRQVQSVKARMTPRQPGVFANFINAELLMSVTPYEL